jgi:predicted aspartyl protease
LIVVCLFGVALPPCYSHAAAICRPEDAVALPLRPQPGLLSIDVSLNNLSATLVVDIGSDRSVLEATTVERLHLPIERKARSLTVFGGIRTNEFVQVDAMQVGGLRQPQEFAVPPETFESSADGMLGADFLGNYMLDFDFTASTLRLYSPETCSRLPGSVVAVPMLKDLGRHVRVPVTLAGKTIAAVLDTGAERSILPLEVAEEVFGLKMANLKKRSVAANGGFAQDTYTYAFGSLGIGGSPVIEGVEVEIWPQGGRSRSRRPMLVGLDILQRFELGISYKDEMVYLIPVR